MDPSACYTAAHRLSARDFHVETYFREEIRIAKILAHVTHGPKHPARAALAFFMPRNALEEGLTVSLFLASDPDQLMREAALDNLVGLGTGSLREPDDAIAAGGDRFYLSVRSRNAQALTAAELSAKPAQLVAPKILVQLALEHYRVLNYRAAASW
jgi:predicted peroxiredoxin